MKILTQIVGSLLLLSGVCIAAESGADGLPGFEPLLQMPSVPTGPGRDGQKDDWRAQPMSYPQAQNLAALKRGAEMCKVGGSSATPIAAESAWFYGLLLLHGRGVPADASAAREQIENAWQCGYSLSAAGLAWCAMDGCGGDVSVGKAQQWIDRLLRVNAGRAIYLRWYLGSRLAPVALVAPVGMARANGALTTEPVMTDLQRLLLQAAALNDVQAQLELGIREYEAGKLEQSQARLKKIAAASEAARINLGILDAQRALIALQARAAPGSPDAGERSAADWFALARRYHRGEGVPADYAEAIRLYRLAMVAGSVPARRMLELVYARRNAVGGIDPEWMAQLAQVDPSDERPVSSRLQPVPVQARLMRRDITPLADLLPVLWQR